MKKIQLIILAVCLTTVTSINAQISKDNTVLKVSYITDNVSDFMVNMLKAQVSDPNEYTKLMNKVSEYKLYHSLYQNQETKETVFVLDSIHKVPGVSTVGHNEFVFTDKEGELLGKEGFLGNEFLFNGNINDLDWNITNESKEINGYKSVRANLKDNSDIYVWFTSDIAANVGPYVYGGLPGLILESNGIFQNTSASTVSYVDQKAFQTAKNGLKMEEQKSPDLSVSDVITKKVTFKVRASKGTK